MIYPRAHLAIGVLCLAIFAAFTWAAVAAGTMPPLANAVFVALTGFGALALWRGWQARVDVWPEGISWRTWMGGTEKLAWSEVEAVVFSRSWKQMQLFGAGRTCGVPLAMTGQKDFAAAVLAHVPEERIEDKTFVLLTVAAHRD